MKSEMMQIISDILTLMENSPRPGFLVYEEPELVKHIQRDIEQIRAMLDFMYRNGTIRKSERWYYYSPSIVRATITRGLSCVGSAARG